MSAWLPGMTQGRNFLLSVVMGGTLSAAALAPLSWSAADTPAALPPPPAWAYPINPPAGHAAPPDDKTLRHVPASRAGFTDAQLADLFVAPDWHPQDHPPAPAIVVHGRPPDVYACGHCHRMGGSGGPENAKLAGLPADYILRQLQDYQRGVRTTAVPSRMPQSYMIRIAKALTPQDMRAAAEYFSTLPQAANIRVVESARVPRTHAEGWRLAADEDGTMEAIGHRIIELPDVPQNFERRDSRTTFTAYVPPGSLARGKLVASNGAGPGTLPCVICHGAQLQGLALAPPIAGRSPTYMIRQLHEIQVGIRAGSNIAPMKIGIAGLSLDDMIAAAAWAASLPPGPHL
jgi:cytochrome c553